MLDFVKPVNCKIGYSIWLITRDFIRVTLVDFGKEFDRADKVRIAVAIFAEGILTWSG